MSNHFDDEDFNENEFMVGQELTVSEMIGTQISKAYSGTDLSNTPRDKIVEKSFIDLVFSELKKVNEIDLYIDTIEDTLNSPDMLNRMQTKELMRWYEMMNVRKNHTRKFLMAFYELSSKNEYMGKVMTQMTGKTVDPKSLVQDDKTKTAKTILQKIMIEKLKNE